MEKRIHVRELPPFASSEDLSDERESPFDEADKPIQSTNVEDMKAQSSTNLTVSGAPRIDISRASSSSHHDDSSPERELVLGTSTSTKLEVAFGEEIATDLHSSTEELSFHDPEEAEKYKKKKFSQTFSDLKDRKDSGCSDIALLSISGRTSRVSSVGSVASAGSGVSNVSHLSVASNLSKASRGSSPHRINVETSFCGPKPVHSISLEVDETVKPIIADKLSQKINPAPIAESPVKHTPENTRKKPVMTNPKTQKFVSLYSDEEEEPIAARSVATRNVPPPLAKIKDPSLDSKTQIYIPLKGPTVKECEPNPNSPKRMKPFTNTTLINFISKYDLDGNLRKNRRATVAVNKRDDYQSTGINEEFQRFISLKDDDDDGTPRRKTFPAKLKHRRSLSTIENEKSSMDEPADNKIVVPVEIHHVKSPSDDESRRPDLPKYLMKTDGTTLYIPLRGDLHSSDGRIDYLTVDDRLNGRSKSDDRNLSRLSPSPEMNRSQPPSTLQLGQPARSARSMTQLPNRGSRTPSPGGQIGNRLVRRCSESAKEIRNIGKPKSRSNSIKSVFSSFFKRGNSTKHKKEKHEGTKKTESLDPKITNVEFKFGQPAKTNEPDTIFIPLRSPDNVTPSEIRCSTNETKKVNVKQEKPLEIKERKSSNFVVMLPAPCVHQSLKTQGRSDGPQSPFTRQIQPEILSIWSKLGVFKPILNRLLSEKLLKDSPPKTSIYAMETSSLKSGSEECPRITKESKKFLNSDMSIVMFEQEPHVRSSKTESKINSEADASSLNLTERTEVKSDSDTVNEDKSDTKQEPTTTENITKPADEFQIEEPLKSAMPDTEIGNYEEETLQLEELTIDNEKDTKLPPEPEAVIVNTEDDAFQSAKSQAAAETPPLAEESVKVVSREEGGENETSPDSDMIALMVVEGEEENKTLVTQSESFDDELPFVPTTLPLERSVAVPIVPIKERRSELRTCSVDRPRSSTPLNPALLDDYVATTSLPTTNGDDTSSANADKIHITLPRTDAAADSPRKRSPQIKKWSEFGTLSPKKEQPPPLPPRMTAPWVSFDESSQEVRQSPKRITTLPAAYDAADANFTFVNPDECTCECHEHDAHST